jgi:hypothetical protein
LPANIRLEWKWFTTTNTLAYDDAGWITVVKNLKMKALGTLI